ncbi:MAG: hypothetical protein P4L81_08350 [Candidatus Pacebacteria bacterium]|nr:hypothetical protein [Candidatus Paceibacterota bacterium]
MPDENAVHELATVAEKIRALDETRRRLMDGYAMGRTNTKRYVERSRAIDRKLKELNRIKVEISNATQDRNGASITRIKQYCANARARLEAITDVETKRKFLHDHLEQILFDRDKLTLMGSIPADGKSDALPFRIHGEIDRKKLRSEAGKKGYAKHVHIRDEHGRMVKTLVGAK